MSVDILTIHWMDGAIGTIRVTKVGKATETMGYDDLEFRNILLSSLYAQVNKRGFRLLCSGSELTSEGTREVIQCYTRVERHT